MRGVSLEPAPIVATPPAEPSAAPRPRPRVWTVLLAYALVFVASAGASIVVVFVAVALRAAREPGLIHDAASASSALGETLQTVGVFLASSLATSAAQAVAALSGGGLSPEPLRSRLALGGRRLDAGAFAVAVLGCLAVSSIFDAAFGALGLEQTGNIAWLGRLLRGLSPAGLAAAVAVAGIAAPVAEELFFRGYVQTRLCRRFGSWAGIFVTAALFGLIHADWIHSPSAFLIGLYLGWLVARSGSIVPAIAGHAVNNTLWTVATSVGLGAQLGRGTQAALLALYVAAAAGAIAWLRPRLAAAAAASPLPPGGGLVTQ